MMWTYLINAYELLNEMISVFDEYDALYFFHLSVIDICLSCYASSSSFHLSLLF